MLSNKTVWVLMALMLGAMPVWAQSSSQGAVGAPELKLVELLLTGNLGLFLGLAVAFLGVYTLSAGQSPAFGLVLIVLGALITLTPSIYKGTRAVICPIIQTLSSNAVCK